jgi:hypothetical protein
MTEAAINAFAAQFRGRLPSKAKALFRVDCDMAVTNN